MLYNIELQLCSTLVRINFLMNFDFWQVTFIFYGWVILMPWTTRSNHWALRRVAICEIVSNCSNKPFNTEWIAISCYRHSSCSIEKTVAHYFTLLHGASQTMWWFSCIKLELIDWLNIPMQSWSWMFMDTDRLRSDVSHITFQFSPWLY